MSSSAKGLLSAIRPELLAELVSRTVVVASRKPTADSSVLEDSLVDFIGRNRFPLRCLLAMPSFVSGNRELVNQLLRRAWCAGVRPEDRAWIQMQAEQLGQNIELSAAPEPASLLLTDSQRRALEELQAIATVFFRGEHVGPVAPRWSTLIVGATGIGKSHLVRCLAVALGLETVRVGVANWIPTGAKAEPASLTAVLERVRKGTRFILHCEEADKLSGKGTDAWSQGQLSELLLLLDGSPGESWTERDRELFRRNALIVATGAWQDVFAAPRRIGFAGTTGGVDRLAQVRASGKVPAELLARFGRHIVLEPLTLSDFHQIAARLGLGNEDYDAEAGVASGQNMRYLESCIAEKALRELRTSRPVGDAVMVGKHL
jgi:energy-coupling factor transporter ATP-binding protein EcfA2